MNLTRKDFLFRSGTSLLPACIAGAALTAHASEGTSSAPAASPFNVRQYGAKGDGQTKDTKTIQAAIDAAGVAGGTVCFPPGKYLSGTVRFKSH